MQTRATNYLDILDLNESRPVAIRRFIRWLGCILLPIGWSLLGAGCVTPIGADRAPTRQAYRQVHEDASSRKQPSAFTQSLLLRLDLAKTFQDTPEEALRLLHRAMCETRDRDFLFALTELSYRRADQLRDNLRPWETVKAPDAYLAAAIYAWFYLFADRPSDSAPLLDDRLRVARDFYNYALGQALTRGRGTNRVASLEPGSRPFAGGTIPITVERTGFPWPLEGFERFLVADQFAVRGLSVRVREPGFGAPLIAIPRPDPSVPAAKAMPLTVLLRVSGGIDGLATAACTASLELYCSYEEAEARVGPRTIPLQKDLTTHIATSLNNSFIWSVGWRQFYSSAERIPSAIYLSQPYQPGRIPVVFVHGTFATPVKWAEMQNTLQADPELRRRFQYWYFVYNSGNPVVNSAVKLREALDAKVRELDPEGKDPALRRMVVVGHSQGGLLTKLTATDTGDRLWRLISDKPFEELELSAEQAAAVRRVMFFERLPFVDRVIFICTPHRGSYQANSLVRKLAALVVSLPTEPLHKAAELFNLLEEQQVKLPSEVRKRVPNSIDSMSPKNPWMLALADLPLASGVTGHSIIAVKGNGDPKSGRDGLVKYESAHVDGTASELVVKSGHSCQTNPQTIREVRRILYEHLHSVTGPTPTTASNRASEAR